MKAHDLVLGVRRHKPRRVLRSWLQDGSIRFPHVVIDGLEHATTALRDAAQGRYLGAVIVTP